MNEDTLNTIQKLAVRIESFAVAALDRTEDNPVLQTLLTEIQEKATAIDALIEKEAR